MTRTAVVVTCAALLGVMVASSACSSDDADAPPDAAPICPIDEDGPEDPFDLTVGVQVDDGQYDELFDDDVCPLIRGPQGALMLVVELHAALPADTDQVCLACTVTVGAAGDFEGIEHTALVGFSPLSADSLSGVKTTILGATDALVPELDGASVPVGVRCTNGLKAGEVTRNVELFVPPPS